MMLPLCFTNVIFQIQKIINSERLELLEIGLKDVLILMLVIIINNFDDGSCQFPDPGFNCSGDYHPKIGDTIEGGIVFYYMKLTNMD